MDKRYDIFRTADATHQGVCIIVKKGTVKKSYVKSESFIIANELIYRGTTIIGVYMEYDLKDIILEQLIKLIHRIKRKHPNCNLIIYGDFNTNAKRDIRQI